MRQKKLPRVRRKRARAQRRTVRGEREASGWGIKDAEMVWPDEFSQVGQVTVTGIGHSPA